MPFGKITTDMLLDEEKPLIGEFACTFNICTTKYINGKLWHKYAKDKQCNILTRKLTAYCREFQCEIDFNRFAFECCPASHQWHIHCVIKGFEDDSVDKMVNHINHVNMPAKIQNYRTCLIKPLFYEEGWLEYLNKDQDKQ